MAGGDIEGGKYVTTGGYLHKGSEKRWAQYLVSYKVRLRQEGKQKKEPKRCIILSVADCGG